MGSVKQLTITAD